MIPRSPAALLVLLLPSLGLAQQRDSAAAARPDSLGVVPLAPLVVSASRTPLRADRVGFALSVVGPAELTREQPRYAADALRHLPAVYVDEAVGPGGPTILRLRGGEEVFTQVLVDGVEANENGGYFDLQGLMLTNVERVEVAHGPQSALYGSSAVSGVVHLLTRRGEVGPPRPGLVVELGDALENGGSSRGVATLAGGSAALRYSGGLGLGFSRGIYRLPHDLRSREASLRVDASPAGRWALAGTLRYMGIDSRLPVRDAGVTRVPLDPNARNERDRLVAAVEAVFAASPRWSQRLRASLFHQDFLYQDRRDDVAQPQDFFVFDANLDYRSRLLRPALEYSASHQLRAAPGTGGLVLSYGALWRREALEEEISGDFSDRVEFDRDSRALFGELLLGVAPRLSALVGARAEKYQGLDATLTPRASVVFDLLPARLSLRAAWGEAFKVPDLRQQYVDNPFIAANPDLQPETSRSLEAGLDLRAPAPGLRAGLTVFRQGFRNLIRTVAQEGSTRQINRNLGRSRAQGVEWSLEVEPAPGWRTGTSGAWIRTAVQENTGLPEAAFPRGEPLPFRPALAADVFAQARLARRLDVAVRGRHVGRQTVLTERFSGRRVELEAYLLAAASASFALTPRLTVYGRVENLFDVTYATAYDRPGIPTTGTLGLRLER